MNVATKSPNAPSPTQWVRRSEDRGRVKLGWLDSRHSFSFGSYHDPNFMGFGDLRVINEDRVVPGGGFGRHGHRDMEILSYVVDGGLGHQDSTGANGVLRPGEVQVMSAGSGIEHSEMNGSEREPVHFLQIWVLPAQRGAAPGYQERDFGRTPGLTLLASPDGAGESLRIGQDTEVSRLLLSTGDTAELQLRRPRAWVQVVGGRLDVNGTTLEPGDGLALEGATALAFAAREDVEALVFDLR